MRCVGQNTENNVMMCARATDGGRKDSELRRELVCVVNMFVVLCLYIMHMYESGAGRSVCAEMCPSLFICMYRKSRGLAVMTAVLT